MLKIIITFICILLLMSCHKNNYAYFEAQNRAKIASNNVGKRNTEEYRTQFLEKYTFYLDFLKSNLDSLSYESLDKGKLIKVTKNNYIEYSDGNPYSDYVCFSFGKFKNGKKKGLWEFYCCGDILSMKYYRGDSSENLFHRITPNYAW